MSGIKRILVTGGAGYVGSHCCKAFYEAGWEVVAFDNLSRGWREFVKWGAFIQGDILDQESLHRAMREVRPHAVAHFAALAYVGESVQRPDVYYRNNVVGSMNILDAMLAHDVRELVFSSTCATYGEPIYLPIDENHPQNPINPYGHSKLMAEKLLEEYSSAFGLRSVALRYFNAAAADPAGAVGERHEPETHLIPLALQAAGDPNFRLKIFGDDYDTQDGTAVRDYIHVCDLAQAHLNALEYLSKGGATAAINLGTGKGTSVLEVLNKVEQVTGRPISKEIVPRRIGDPAVLVASSERATSLLQWSPSSSDLTNIIKDAWAWYQSEAARR